MQVERSRFGNLFGDGILDLVADGGLLLWHQKHANLMLYAVLAAVSDCYPPLKGRLLTRYSPVRH